MEELIYCQRDIPEDKWRYGIRSSAATGCGWIATYNALRIMGYEVQPEEILKACTAQLPLVHGTLGTTILSPAFFFRKRGFRVEHTARNERFDEVAKRSDVCILFYRWHQKLKVGAHFVALHHTPEGFIGYNTYRTSKGPDRYGESLESFLKQRKYFGCVLFGIRKGK